MSREHHDNFDDVGPVETRVGIDYDRYDTDSWVLGLIDRDLQEVRRRLVIGQSVSAELNNLRRRHRRAYMHNMQIPMLDPVLGDVLQNQAFWQLHQPLPSIESQLSYLQRLDDIHSQVKSTLLRRWQAFNMTHGAFIDRQIEAMESTNNVIARFGIAQATDNVLQPQSAVWERQTRRAWEGGAVPHVLYRLRNPKWVSKEATRRYLQQQFLL